MAVIAQLPKVNSTNFLPFCCMLTMKQDMGGAEGKVAYIGKSATLGGKATADLTQTPREHSVLKESKRLQNDLVVNFPKIMQ